MENQNNFLSILDSNAQGCVYVTVWKRCVSSYAAPFFPTQPSIKPEGHSILDHRELISRSICRPSYPHALGETMGGGQRRYFFYTWVSRKHGSCLTWKIQHKMSLFCGIRHFTNAPVEFFVQRGLHSPGICISMKGRNLVLMYSNPSQRKLKHC